eukprot:11228358-Lingulodinium_polyedra.AAC.3
MLSPNAASLTAMLSEHAIFACLFCSRDRMRADWPTLPQLEPLKSIESQQVKTGGFAYRSRSCQPVPCHIIGVVDWGADQ